MATGREVGERGRGTLTCFLPCRDINHGKDWASLPRSAVLLTHRCGRRAMQLLLPWQRTIGDELEEVGGGRRSAELREGDDGGGVKEKNGGSEDDRKKEMKKKGEEKRKVG